MGILHNWLYCVILSPTRNIYNDCIKGVTLFFKTDTAFTVL